MATEQVKRITRALKQAGFNRSEFSAQAERKQKTIDGQVYVEYGKTRIHISATKERQLSLVDAMVAADLRVTIPVYGEDKKIGYPMVEEGNGALIIWDTTKTEKNPLGERYAIAKLGELLS